MNNPKGLRACCLWALILTGGCAQRAALPQLVPSPANKQTPPSPQTGRPPAHTSPNAGDAPEWRKDAWNSFTASARYRVANESDFTIPEAAASNEYAGSDLARAIKYPFIAGDINHDGLTQDFAVITVDTSRADAARFSLVIFNQPADGATSAGPHWLYRDRDLSTTTLTWWSGGLAVRKYRADGTFDLCYVNWNKQRQEYSCDKAYKR